MLLLNVAESNSFNGGTFLALAGEDSVVLCTDSRFSHYRFNSLLLGMHPRSVYRIGSKTLMGCYGLDADALSLVELLREKLSEHFDSELYADNIVRVVSNLLYERNLLISPLLAGMDRNNKPFLCSMDSLGALTITKDFVATGTSNAQLQAICEALYTPNLKREDLVLLAERCLQLAFQRDILSGGNLKLVVMYSGGIRVKELAFQDV